MSDILNFDRVEVSFGGKPVIHDVSFPLHPGEILGLVGESGSGKSTLLKAAMGLLGRNGLVTGGDIWFEGKSIPDLTEKELRKIRGEKIGMVFQDCGASLSPIRTVGAQILESLAAHGIKDCVQSKEKALEMFEKMNLKDAQKVWNSYPFELSGGMNQRVGIAMAMLLSPRILLADEPTSALDAAVQRQVIEAMLHVREVFGTAIILVTHDMNVVGAVADTILVLQNGNVMEYGNAKDVLENPQHSYTRELLWAVPKLRRV